MKINISGVRTATKKLARGRVGYYAYAYTGGPAIGKGVGPTKAAAWIDLCQQLQDPEALERFAAAQRAKSLKAAPSTEFATGLATAYLKSPEWTRLAPRTQKDWRPHVDEFASHFKKYRTELFEDPRIAQDLASWRDKHPSERQGHMRIEVVSRIFSWGRGRGLTSARPTSDIQKIYKTNRSDKIWSGDDVAAIIGNVKPKLAFAIRLAILTGLRQGDLLKLRWTDVSDNAIQSVTAKRNKVVIIPLYTDLRALLDEIPRKGPIILTSSSDMPWTPDGLRASFAAAKKRAGKKRPGILELRWHDFRGTAVTRLAKTKLTLRDIARIMGWSEDRVEAIMELYVSADALAKDMLERMDETE